MVIGSKRMGINRYKLFLCDGSYTTNHRVRKTKDRPFVASFNLKFWISGMNGANYLTVYDSENKNKLITYKLTEE